MELKKPPAIIPALDLELGRAVELVEKLDSAKNKIAGLKIGSLLVMEHGLKKVVSEIKAVSSLPIIYDHQKGCTDIPEIIEKQVQAVANAGADVFIAVPHGAGKNSLESFVQSCKKFKIEPIVLLEMTHPGANDFLQAGIQEKIFNFASNLGVKYFVVPGNKPEKIKEYSEWRKAKSEKPIYFLSPGIGAQGGQAKDAVQNGTDYPIVGRAIYGAEKPVEVVNVLYKECLEGWKNRK